MYGFYNRLLRVDVGTRSWTSEDIPDEILTQYLGGKGLGAHLLQSNSPTGVDPLSPENPFIITTGPATGSVLAAAGRHCTIAKSPLTGVFGESYSGGHVAPRIKATGYDAIIVQGAADTPVFIEISDQAVHIHDATAFWGMDSYETQDALQDAVAVRGARAIAIGPAGEQMIPFAVVGNDHGRHAGDQLVVGGQVDQDGEPVGGEADQAARGVGERPGAHAGTSLGRGLVVPSSGSSPSTLTTIAVMLSRPPPRIAASTRASAARPGSGAAAGM